MKHRRNVNEAIYNSFSHRRLFFLKYNENRVFDRNGNEKDFSTWESPDPRIKFSVDANCLTNKLFDYGLCIIDNVEKINEEGKDSETKYALTFHEFNLSSSTDWHVIFNDYIEKRKINNKFSAIAIIWVLDKYKWTIPNLKTALGCYDKNSIQEILAIMVDISRCLSYNKQSLIKDLLSEYHIQYDIYSPRFIEDAANSVKPNLNDLRNRNLFQLVDFAFIDNINNPQYEHVIDTSSGNILIKLYSWLHADCGLEDYQFLKNVFPWVNEAVRLKIVKRYFHDVRCERIVFDPILLAQFRDNNYDVLIRYRYCLETPESPIVLTVPLLCDSILTLKETKGSAFQTFDGVLDFAVAHCDISNPSVDFQFDRIIPTCQGGAIYNSSFKGFVNYNLICTLDNTLFTEDHISYVIRFLLDRYGRRKCYFVCKSGDGTPLPEEVLVKCRSIIKTGNYNPKEPDCCSARFYDDQWVFSLSEQNAAILNTFLLNAIEANNKTKTICWNDISIDRFKQSVVRLANKYDKIGDTEFIMPSCNSSSRTPRRIIVDFFVKILRMNIFPQKGALVSHKFNIFGFFRPEMINRDPHSEEYEKAFEDYKQKESQEVYNRTMDSLKKFLKKEPVDNDFFELEYDEKLLEEILNKYYFKDVIIPDDRLINREFLTTQYVKTNIRPFCAPNASENNNPAIDLPYFWCRGKECFHNCLNNQTIEETNNWELYSLYHLVEIIGLPVLEKKEAGYEPKLFVRQFIAITNKVLKMFNRLRCTSCGHLLFSQKGIGFNRYNYFRCENPECDMYWKDVYLSYCYSCKTGLIDSRDTARCPNGWFICPSCLSCCDDAQYERLRQRYILENKPVPSRIKSKIGQGHNDKDKYFCPTCGSPIEFLEDEHGNKFRYCRNCNKNYDRPIEGYY